MSIHLYRHIYINTQLKYFAVHLILTQNCNSTTLQLKKKIQINEISKNLFFVDLPYKNAKGNLLCVNTKTLYSYLKPYKEIKNAGRDNYIAKCKINYYISCLKSLCLSLCDVKDQGIK